MKEECKLVAFEVLVDYYESRLTGAKAEQVERHISGGCERCRRHLTWLSRYLPAVHHASAEPMLHASSSSLNAAFQLYRERYTAPARPSLSVLIARLIFDSRQSQSLELVGVRGESHAEHQVVYSTGDHDIDLWQEPLGDGLWYVIGQVLPKMGEDAVMPDQVILTSSDGRVLIGSVGNGEFCIRSTPAGVYEARLMLSSNEIVLPDVAIGS